MIETLEPTVFFSITYDSLQELYDKYPKAERLGRLIISDLFIKKDDRFFDQLNKNTRERFLEYVRTHPQMLQRVPQKYIASYLNIKPETFSRLKHLMRPKRGVGVRGRLEPLAAYPVPIDPITQPYKYPLKLSGPADGLDGRREWREQSLLYER